MKLATALRVLITLAELKRRLDAGASLLDLLDWWAEQPSTIQALALEQAASQEDE